MISDADPKWHAHRIFWKSSLIAQGCKVVILRARAAVVWIILDRGPLRTKKVAIGVASWTDAMFCETVESRIDNTITVLAARGCRTVRNAELRLP